MEALAFEWRLAGWIALLALASLAYLSAVTAGLILARTQREHEARLQRRVQVAVTTSVRAVHQLTADGLKVSSRDRRLTPEQQRELRQMAMDSAKLQIGARGLADLARTLRLDASALDELLVIWTEAAVHQLARRERAAIDRGTAGSAVPFVA